MDQKKVESKELTDKVSNLYQNFQITKMMTSGEIKNQVVELNPSSPKAGTLELSASQELLTKKSEGKQSNSSLIAIDRQPAQQVQKMRTDEDIPLKFQESEKLIEKETIVKHSTEMPTVQQKYDLVSKNQD